LQNTRLPKPKQLAIYLNIGNLTLLLQLSILVLATFAFYSQDLIMIFTDALSNEATSYLLIVPFVFAYMIFRKRKMLRASISETQTQPDKKRLGMLSGLLLCTIAVLLYWYGSSTFTPIEYNVFTLPLFVSGLILILFNPQTLRQAAFPVLFLFLLVPPPTEFFNTIGSTLSVASTEVPNAIINFLGVPSTISGEFGTPTVTITRADATPVSFNVSIACSGIYSLLGFVVFAAFTAFIIRDKPWKKAIVFLIGLPLVYALNIVRITTILLIGYQWGEQLALDVFHLLGGWILILIGTFILLFISEKVFKTRIFTHKETNITCPTCNPGPLDKQETYCNNCGRLLRYPKIKPHKLDIAKVVAVASVTMLLVMIQAPVFALTKGPAQILIQTPQGEQGNTQIFPQFPGYDLLFAYRDTAFEQVSGQNLSLMYEYLPQHRSQDPIWLGVEIADSITPLHAWEFCLITWPQTHNYQSSATQLDLRDVNIQQNPPVTARYFAWNDTKQNRTELVLYWKETTVFTINNVSQQKHVQISLITFPENVSASEASLLPMAEAIAQYWEPIRTWNTLALFLSHNALILAATMAVLLAAIPIFSIFKNQKQKKLNQLAFQKLSKPNQQLIEIIKKTEKLSVPNLDKIAEVYKETIDKKVQNEKLRQELDGLEKTGLIKRRVISNQDSPVQGWRT
jgi:exosortase